LCPSLLIWRKEVQEGTDLAWRLDEVSVSTGGFVSHEVLFSSNARWLIESEEIQFRWVPFNLAFVFYFRGELAPVQLDRHPVPDGNLLR
jgi:hypothetical protein